jgi:hypothetical protein
MWHNLKDIPPSLRPAPLPLFPSGWQYFQRWRSLRWFVLLLLPGTVSVLVSAWRHGVQAILGLAILTSLTAAITAILFIALCSGCTSSNWGTWFRSREPFRYWLDVFILSIAYFALSGAAWLMK